MTLVCESVTLVVRFPATPHPATLLPCYPVTPLPRYSATSARCGVSPGSSGTMGHGMMAPFPNHEHALGFFRTHDPLLYSRGIRNSVPTMVCLSSRVLYLYRQEIR